MSVILLLVIFSGSLISYVLLNGFGLTNPIIRYPIIIVSSYLLLFLYVRIYLQEILFDKNSTSDSDSLVNDFVFELGDIGPSFNKGSIDLTIQTSLESDLTGLTEILDAGDDEIGLVLLIAAISIVLVFGSSFILIWHSPELLSECLVQIFLVTGIERKIHKYRDSYWIAHFFKATILPFAFIFALGFLVGLGMYRTCPTAQSFKQYIQVCKS